MTSKSLLPLIGLLTLITSCGTKIGYKPIEKSDLVGTWIFDKQNDTLVVTDEIFIIRFNENGTQDYFFREKKENGNSKWTEVIGSTYQIDGDTITITDKDFTIKHKVRIFADKTTKSLDSIACAEILHNKNGENLHTGVICKGYRAKNNYSDFLIGKWYGIIFQNTPNGTAAQWNFLDDGTYTFYIENEKGEWVKANPIDCNYYIYDNILVGEWNEDIASKTAGDFCEIWYFDLEDNKMEWRSKKKNNVNDKIINLKKIK